VVTASYRGIFDSKLRVLGWSTKSRFSGGVATGPAEISLECFGQVVSIKLEMDNQNRARFVGPHVEIGGDTIVVVEPCAHMLEGVG
jgi:hypothetical protein